MPKPRHNIRACRRRSQPVDFVFMGQVETVLDSVAREMFYRFVTEELPRQVKRFMLNLDVGIRRN